MIGLEYIRKLNKDTCESLAEKIGVTNPLVSQWESGKKPIPQKRISEIATLYNVKPEYITKELTYLEKLHLDYEFSDNDKTVLRKKIAIEEVLEKITIDLLKLDEISELNIIVSAISKTDDTEQTFKKSYKSEAVQY